MKLIYSYINRFRNIHNQEVNFSERYTIHYVNGSLSFELKEVDGSAEYLYGNGFMRDLRVIVGKTGSGKTNLLQLLGMDKWERHDSMKRDSYLMLYKTEEEDTFLVECVGLDIVGVTDLVTYDKDGNCENVYKFKYLLDNGEIVDVSKVSFDEYENTYIINAFDRYAFAHCPYQDERIEGVRMEEGFLPRLVAPFGRSSASMECECLSEYVASFPEDSVKRNISFVIRWDNWQDKIQLDLDEKLLKQDYWTYKSRAAEQRERNLRKGIIQKKIKYPKGSTPKSRFIHDLMTDFAIYLRKWAECVDESYPKSLGDFWGRTIYELGIEDPTILPDFQQISILKRINWLCQYLDYHTDEMFANRGLIWQAGQDVIDLFFLLDKLDDKYFTDEEFSIPVSEINWEGKSPMQQIFERIDQYRPDEVGVFTKELLPYHWSCVSSGEYQYAKVWGIVEEYAIRVKHSKQGEDYRSAIQPNFIILMDEPECYMHPELCRRFISKMSQVLQRRNPDTQLQVILTTHSPFMLSDVLSHQVIRMDYDEHGLCHIMQDTGSSYFAANIHSILADGFFLQYTIGELSRQFLVDKFNLFKEMLEKKGSLSEIDRGEIERMRAFIPHIGDDMLRFSFEKLLSNFPVW